MIDVKTYELNFSIFPQQIMFHFYPKKLGFFLFKISHFPQKLDIVAIMTWA